MEKLSILMNRESFASWGEAHPLGSQIMVNVAGVELSGVVAELSDYHGKIEVRIRLSQKAKGQ